MIIHNCDQRSEKWFKLRCGKITASNAHKLLTPAKFKTYALELIAEQVTGHMTEHFVSDAMQWGIDNEPFAFDWYQEKTGYQVETCGFVEMDDLFAGCSPDLIIGSEGMAQIKCPTPKTHIDYLMHGPSSEILAQMQFEMMVFGAQWNDFVSYDPRYPEKMMGCVHHIERDENYIRQLRELTEKMILHVDTFMMERGMQRKSLNITDAVPVKKETFNDWEILHGAA